ncbi:RDD family protein [Idiomarina seosinensis]|uniref:RDD family protein n=1 Tax=Idiomarina seosinensis TaxID=281739 RepID=UPI00384F2C3D
MITEAQKLHASFPSAGFLRRLAAWFYDLLVAAAIIMLASALALAFAGLLSATGIIQLDQNTDHAAWLSQGPWYGIYLVLVLGTFFGYFWKTSGQTVGMRAWRLKLQNRDGSKLSLKQTVLRLLTCFGGIGSLWVLVDFKNRRAIQDYVAGTELVVLSKDANQLFYWHDL